MKKLAHLPRRPHIKHTSLNSQLCSGNSFDAAATGKGEPRTRRRKKRDPSLSAGRLGRPGRTMTKEEEPRMYIGLGTVVLIVVILAVVMFLRRG
jgi:hypothetical protein